METTLRIKTAAPGERDSAVYDPLSVYDSIGLPSEFVEKLSPIPSAGLTPAEAPGMPGERMAFMHQYPASVVDDEDIEDDDEDLDDELDEVELDDEDIEEDVDDADLDDEEIDLELEGDEDEEDDII